MTRRTNFFSLFVLLLPALALFGACGDKKTDANTDPKDTAPPSGVPTIVAVNGNFNFGKVKQGSNVEHIFKIRNTGSADLKIEKARGS